MRGAGSGGAAGFGATGTEGWALAVIDGGVGGGGAGMVGVAAGRAGDAAAGGAATGGATTGDAATTGASGCTEPGAVGRAAGVTSFAAGGITTGRLTGAGGATTALSSGGCAMGGGATGGGTGRGATAGATASFCCVIAFSTSPGREMCDKSILVLISSSPRVGRELDLPADDEPSAPERMYTRTFSASCSSRELECVFFSVTPTSGSVSRIALLLTSSSRARSLIRTLLIRPFASPCCS
jgi:hypothetical protein